MMFGSSHEVPGLTEGLYNPPSESLYQKFRNAVQLRHGSDVIFKQHGQHNHYLVVLRECAETEHYQCIQSLYAACPILCCDHSPIPVSQKRLTRFLKDYLKL